MKKKLLAGVFALTLATALSSCSPEETDTDTTPTKSDYELLLDSVATSIINVASCADSCHIDGGMGAVSGLVFNGTSSADIEAGITNYIAADYSRNSVKAKTVPATTGETHTGGNVWLNKEEMMNILI